MDAISHQCQYIMRIKGCCHYFKPRIKYKWIVYKNINECVPVSIKIYIKLWKQLGKGKDRFHSHFSDDSTNNVLVKWKSYSYTLKYYHNIGRYVIKVGELVHDSVYLNKISNFKQWYTTQEK